MERSGDAAAAADIAQANKAVALSFLEAIAAGDLARIDDLLDPRLQWWVQGWGDVDRDRFVPSLGQTITRASARKMDVLFITAEDDRVAVAAQGEFLFPEGAYRNSYHYLFTIAGGRIDSGREYLDTQIAARFYAG